MSLVTKPVPYRPSNVIASPLQYAKGNDDCDRDYINNDDKTNIDNDKYKTKSEPRLLTQSDLNDLD